MKDNEKWVSVKIYAEQKGITKQAVYNAINAGKIKSRVKDGQKVVLLDAPIKETPAAEEPAPAQSAADKQVIDALLQQIEEKDRQIQRQQQLLEEHIKLAKELNETINALRELVRNEQQLQARSQLLLKEQREAEQPAAEEPAPAPVPYDTEPEQPAAQGNFFTRLFAFGRKGK